MPIQLMPFQLMTFSTYAFSTYANSTYANSTYGLFNLWPFQLMPLQLMSSQLMTITTYAISTYLNFLFKDVSIFNCGARRLNVGAKSTIIEMLHPSVSWFAIITPHALYASPCAHGGLPFWRRNKIQTISCTVNYHNFSAGIFFICFENKKELLLQQQTDDVKRSLRALML